MAITPSQRPTREWPLLVLALALVCAICVPLWQWTAGGDSAGDFLSRWTPERLAMAIPLAFGPTNWLTACSHSGITTAHRSRLSAETSVRGV